LRYIGCLTGTESSMRLLDLSCISAKSCAGADRTGVHDKNENSSTITRTDLRAHSAVGFPP
jgi:hypothetical protein